MTTSSAKRQGLSCRWACDLLRPQDKLTCCKVQDFHGVCVQPPVHPAVCRPLHQLQRPEATPRAQHVGQLLLTVG